MNTFPCDQSGEPASLIRKDVSCLDVQVLCVLHFLAFSKCEHGLLANVPQMHGLALYINQEHGDAQDTTKHDTHSSTHRKAPTRHLEVAPYVGWCAEG